MSNVVIEIPSIKKEILRVAAYCRVSTVYDEQQSSLNILKVMMIGHLQAFIMNKPLAHALTTEMNSIV